MQAERVIFPGERRYITFRLALPPSANHIYEPIVRRTKKGNLAHGKMWSVDYKLWRLMARQQVGDWAPPRCPLGVQIDLHVPLQTMRRSDVDGYIKPLLDAVVGPRSDQYIDRLVVLRSAVEGEGYAVVTVEEL